MRHLALIFSLSLATTAGARSITAAIESVSSNQPICRGFNKTFRGRDAKELLRTMQCLEFPHLNSCASQLLTNPQIRKGGFDWVSVLKTAGDIASPAIEYKLKKSFKRSFRKRLMRYGVGASRQIAKIGVKGLGLLMLPAGLILDGAENSTNCGEGTVGVDSSCRPITRANIHVLVTLDKVIRDLRRGKKNGGFFDGSSIGKCQHLFKLLGQARKDLKRAIPKDVTVRCGPNERTIKVSSAHGGSQYSTTLTVKKTKRGHQVRKFFSSSDSLLGSLFDGWKAKADSTGLIKEEDYHDMISSSTGRPALHRVKMITPLAMAKCTSEWRAKRTGQKMTVAVKKKGQQ